MGEPIPEGEAPKAKGRLLRSGDMVDVFEPRMCEAVCSLILLTNGVIHVCRHPRGHSGAHECNCGAFWRKVDPQ